MKKPETHFTAGAIDGGSDVEKLGVAKDGEIGVGKRDTFGEGSTDEDQGGGFGGSFRGEAGGGFFGFAENVRDFVLAADVGVALEFAKTGGGEIDLAAGGEARTSLRRGRLRHRRDNADWGGSSARSDDHRFAVKMELL